MALQNSRNPGCLTIVKVFSPFTMNFVNILFRCSRLWNKNSYWYYSWFDCVIGIWKVNSEENQNYTFEPNLYFSSRFFVANTVVIFGCNDFLYCSSAVFNSCLWKDLAWLLKADVDDRLQLIITSVSHNWHLAWSAFNFLKMFHIAARTKGLGPEAFLNVCLDFSEIGIYIFIRIWTICSDIIFPWIFTHLMLYLEDFHYHYWNLTRNRLNPLLNPSQDLKLMLLNLKPSWNTWQPKAD